LAVLTVGLVALAFPVVAFHDQGVAHCNECHTMHNSQDGQLVDPNSPNGNAWLLVDSAPSDICLHCHATGLGAVFAADPLVPGREIGGGNFTFLLEDNINDGHGGATNAILGESSGHSIVAPGWGVGADTKLLTAPGGTFPGSLMSCTSCHDPHGNTNFRLLYGAGPVQGGTDTFTNPAPIAAGMGIFGGPSESNTNHTAYQSGMSAWCSNCHTDYHANTGQLIHKSGTTMGGSYSQTYNLYDGTGNLTPGTFTTAYLAATPFEDPANTTTATTGTVAASQVSCISCHRAHATSAPDAGRWDFSVTLLDDDGVESSSYITPNPYGTAVQRSLCNKCHAKD